MARTKQTSRRAPGGKSDKKQLAAAAAAFAAAEKADKDRKSAVRQYKRAVKLVNGMHRLSRTGLRWVPDQAERKTFLQQLTQVQKTFQDHAAAFGVLSQEATAVLVRLQACNAKALAQATEQYSDSDPEEVITS